MAFRSMVLALERRFWEDNFMGQCRGGSMRLELQSPRLYLEEVGTSATEERSSTAFNGPMFQGCTLSRAFVGH